MTGFMYVQRERSELKIALCVCAPVVFACGLNFHEKYIKFRPDDVLIHEVYRREDKNTLLLIDIPIARTIKFRINNIFNKIFIVLYQC